MTDELRAKFEAWWQRLLQTPCGTSYNSQMPAEGDYRGIALLAYEAAHASRDAEVEALKAKVAWMREYEKGLNRRAEVEEVLFEVARGKRAPLSADECRKLAIKLGVESKREEK